MVSRFFVPIGEALALHESWIEHIAQLNGKSYKEVFLADAPTLNDVDNNTEEDDNVEDGIAHIRLIGPVVRYTDICARLFGGCGIDMLSARLDEIKNDDTVKAVVMEVDSPGGQAAGVADFADKVRELSLIKPIVVFVSDIGASAAYWIASAASKIVISQTASVGSIGVYAAVTDNSKAMEDAGYKQITFVSSQSPKKRPDYTSDEGRAQIQKQIDTLASVFVDAVAKFRGVDSDTVLKEFGQGDIVFAQDAVNRNMADQVGTIDDAFKMAINMIQHESVDQTFTQTSLPNNGGYTNMTREELLSQSPELVAEIAKTAAAEERARIKEIEALETDANMAVAGDIIKSAKYTEGMNASDVALKILNAQSDANAKANADRKEDSSVIPSAVTENSNSESAIRDAHAKMIAEAAANYVKRS